MFYNKFYVVHHFLDKITKTEKLIYPHIQVDSVHSP